MLRKILVMLLLVAMILVGCKGSSPKNDAIETGSGSKAETKGDQKGFIEFDISEHEDMDLAYSLLYQEIMEYLSLNPIVRDNYYPLQDLLEVVVKDGKIDLSDFRLLGDINGDGIVDTEDLDLAISKYIAKESGFSLKDIEDVVNNLMSESFNLGLYTLSGDRLAIPRVAYNERSVLDVSSLGIKDGERLNIVPEDINGASVMNPLPSPRSDEAIVDSFMETIIAQVLAQFTRVPEKYLVSWGVSVAVVGRTGQYVEGTGVVADVYGVLEPYYSLLTEAFTKDIVIPHFGYHPRNKPLDAESVVVYTDDPYRWIAFSGNRPFTKGDFKYNEDLEAVNSSRAVTVATNVGGRTIRIILAIRDMAIYNDPSSERNVTLNVSGWGNPNGRIVLNRIGPGQGHTFELSADMQRGNTTEFVDLFTGDYRAELHNDCQNFRLLITDAQSFFYDVDFALALSIPHRVTVTGRVVDEESGEGIPDVTVELKILCPSFEIEDIPPVQTDGSGNFVFENVPYGIYQVLVEGSPRMELRLDDSSIRSVDLGNFSLKQLYDIILEYKNYVYGNGFTAYWSGRTIYKDNEIADRTGYRVMLNGYLEFLSELGDYSEAEHKSLMNDTNFMSEPDRYDAFTVEKAPGAGGYGYRYSDVVPVGMVIVKDRSGEIYLEITPLWDATFGGSSDLGLAWEGPLVSRYYTLESIRLDNPSAGPTDGSFNGYVGKVNKSDFMRIFDGGTFTQSGKSIIRQYQRFFDYPGSVGKVADEYKITIRPHVK